MREPPGTSTALATGRTRGQVDVSDCHQHSADVSPCHQQRSGIRSGTWVDGSRTRAAGSSRQPSRSTASAGSNRPRSRRSPGGRGSRSERSSATSPTSARCCSRAAGLLQELFVNTLADAPDSAAPIDAVAAALESAAVLFQERREHAQTAPGRHRRERGAPRTRADQARVTRRDPRRRAAPARRRRAGREPDGRGGHRRLQGRVRTLGQRDQPARPVAAHPGVARRAEGRDRGQMIIGGRPGARSWRPSDRRWPTGPPPGSRLCPIGAGRG